MMNIHKLACYIKHICPLLMRLNAKRHIPNTSKNAFYRTSFQHYCQVHIATFHTATFRHHEQREAAD